MAKKIKKKQQLKKGFGTGSFSSNFSIPLKRFNFVAFGLGILTIIIGYILLSFKPWDNFIALNVAPVVLIFGYVVVFIFGILGTKDLFSKKKVENLDMNDIK